MWCKKFVGVGKSLEEATENLQEAAKNGIAREHAAGRDETLIETDYICRVKVSGDYVNGQPCNDYDEALRSAFRTAGISVNKAKSRNLEVIAIAEYRLHGRDYGNIYT